MHRPSFLAAAVTVCTAALFAPPSHAQPSGPPPPPPPYDPGDPYGPPPDYAQPPPGPYAQPPAPEPFQRRGWFLGFGLAVGAVGDEDSDSYAGGQLNAYFGGLINPRIALVVELALGGYQPDDYYDYYGEELQINLASFVLGGQFFLGDQLWLRAGLGSTRLTLVDSYGDSYGDAEGRTFAVAAGYEIIQRTSFALDLNVSLAATAYDGRDFGEADTTAMHFGVGFSWY